MSLQAHDYPEAASPPPPGPAASHSFSFERIISPERRPPSLPQADLQPTKLWRCSLADPGKAGGSPIPTSRHTVPHGPRLPELQPAVAAKIDPVEQLLAIPPGAAPAGERIALDSADAIPPGPPAEPERLAGVAVAKLAVGPAIRPELCVWVGDPTGHGKAQESRVQFAENPLLSKDWPVINASAGLAPAPLLDWQIERGRERRRGENKAAAQPAKNVVLPDRPPEASPDSVRKAVVISFQISKGMKRWLTLAASLAILALGAVRFGPSTIDRLNQALEPRAAFVFFDDPSTGAGPWWPSEKFHETEDRTFTVAGLALNRETIGRGDLRFDFEVKAGSGGFGWVAGAKDEKNYLAYKLAVKGRHKKEYVLVRYPVVNGEPNAEQRDEFPVSADLFEGEFNKISVRVRDDKLTVLINGQGVDYWTNPGAVHGGVGFFTEKGDNPSIRSVRVDGNDDFTGLMARGTIDTLKGVRDILAGESDAHGSVAGGEISAAGSTD